MSRCTEQSGGRNEWMKLTPSTTRMRDRAFDEGATRSVLFYLKKHVLCVRVRVYVCESVCVCVYVCVCEYVCEINKCV